MSISRVWVETRSAIGPCAIDVAVVDDRGDVAGLLDLVEQVRGEQHGAALGDQLADQVAELEDAGGVEAVDRLVEDQQLGVAEQAAGDAEALAHAERVGADLVVGPAAEADALERGVDAPVGALVARRGVHVQVLAAGEMAVEARLLDDRADARQRLRAVVLAEQADRAAGGLREPEQQPDQRRLAGAVGAQEAEGAAARHLEVDVLEGGAIAEALPEALGVDGQIGHGREATAGWAARLSAGRVNLGGRLIRSDELALEDRHGPAGEVDVQRLVDVDLELAAVEHAR